MSEKIKISIDFTEGSIRQIKKLKPMEFKLYLRVIALSQSKGHMNVGLTEMENFSLGGILMTNHYFNSLSKLGLLNKTYNYYLPSSYFDREKVVMTWDEEFLNNVLSKLKSAEMFLLFNLMLEDLRGGVVQVGSISTFGPKKIKKLTNRLTSVGFLSPLVKSNDLLIGTLYDSVGNVLSKGD